MLQHWLNSTPDASWKDIIVALKTIGHHTLSVKLREKYILPLAGQQDCSIPPDHTGLAIVPSTLLKLGCHCDTPVCHFSTGPLTKLVLNGFKLTI